MNIVEVLLKELKVRHSKSFVEENYVNAPDSDNMLGIQRILSRYNIETIGVYFHDKEKAGLTFPCIMHLKNSFVIGIDLKDDNIKYHNGSDYITEPVLAFNEKWSGNSLFVTNIQNAKEPMYKNNKITDFFNIFIYYYIPILIVCIGGYSIIKENIIGPQSINIIFDLFGLAICLLLFQKQLHAQSIIADRVCSFFQKGGCDSVLNSADAKLFGMVSWSEIGLAYFSSRVLFGCLYENSLMSLYFIGWIAMLYGLWSIWYQAFKINRWCTLCCMVQAVVWGEGIFSIFIIKRFSILYIDLFVYAVYYVTSFVVIHLFSNLYSLRERFNRTNKEFLSLKMQRGILETAMKGSEEIIVGSNVSSIVYGCKTAPITLSVLTNPHCNPCASMHNRLIQLIKLNPKVNIQYIYSSFSEELEDSSLFCIAVYQQKSHKEAIELLDKWYKFGKYQRQRFIKKSGVNIRQSEVLVEYAKHVSWKKDTGISATPTIIYNGHELPDYYDIEDFVYLDKEK